MTSSLVGSEMCIRDRGDNQSLDKGEARRGVEGLGAEAVASSEESMCGECGTMLNFRGESRSIIKDRAQVGIGTNDGEKSVSDG
eukprot:7474597-Prorocentrum_lima.AAC.1